MKAIRYILPVLIVGLILSSYLFDDDDEIRELLDDKAKRTMVMTEIVNDHEMMMEMAEHIHSNDHAMMMMRQNNMMMNKMMKNMKKNMMRNMMGNMMEMMEDDSTTCMEMREMMMGNKHMKSMMREMCNEEGMRMKQGMQNGNGHMHKHRRMNNKE